MLASALLALSQAFGKPRDQSGFLGSSKRRKACDDRFPIAVIGIKGGTRTRRDLRAFRAASHRARGEWDDQQD